VTINRLDIQKETLLVHLSNLVVRCGVIVLGLDKAVDNAAKQLDARIEEVDRRFGARIDEIEQRLHKLLEEYKITVIFERK